MTEEQIHQRLAARFEEAVLGFHGDVHQPWSQVEPMRVGEVAQFLRDEADLAFDRCLLVSGVDWEGHDANGKGKHREINRYEEDGTVNPVEEPGTGDLEVVYHIESSRHGHRFVFKARMPREMPQVHSASLVWTTAAYGERETYDFYGIEFVNHPDLRRLFLPEDWEGWPLRKDYEMPKRYHDVPLEGLGLAVRDRP